MRTINAITVHHRSGPRAAEEEEAHEEQTTNQNAQ